MAKATSDEVTFGEFERASDGRRRVASTQADAVRMRFEGWREVTPASPGAEEAVLAATGPAEPEKEQPSRARKSHD